MVWEGGCVEDLADQKTCGCLARSYVIEDGMVRRDRCWLDTDALKHTSAMAHISSNLLWRERETRPINWSFPTVRQVRLISEGGDSDAES